MKRTDNIRTKEEKFRYDELNRLINYNDVNQSYDIKGNIISNSSLGNFGYSCEKPYAINTVSLIENALPIRNQQISYNTQMRPTEIAAGDFRTVYSYDGDGFRLKSENYQLGMLSQTKYYIGGHVTQ